MVGLSVGGTVADYTEFDRKNYFYPDIPKGYQISQYKYPLISGGALAGVSITRIHLEEDTAKSSHEGEGESLVDFNRAGVPLMELVTEPVIHTAEDAGRFARELRLVLRYLDVSDAEMEKGQMRVEANISISKDSTLGTKVEVKNLNSFRAVERAIAYELARQQKVLEAGEAVVQETRGWDDAKQVTFSQRKKEHSHDYRYFPDPDLPKLSLSKKGGIDISRLSEILPDLPSKIREKYSLTGLSSEVSEVLVQNKQLSGFFSLVEKEVSSKEAILASNYIASDLQSLLKDKEESGGNIKDALSAPEFATIIKMLSNGEISSKGAKTIIGEWYKRGIDPRALASELGVLQNSDPQAIAALVDSVIASNPSVVAEFKAGKETSLQFLAGQAMKESKGSANPTLLQQVLREKLSS